METRHSSSMQEVPRIEGPEVTPADVLDEWKERAAIMQHDGGLSKDEAEVAAWERTIRHHGRLLAAQARAQLIREMKR